VFFDESGMLMAPLVRRSCSHQKVSAIAELCILPTRDRIALYFRSYPQANINAERALDFLGHLQRQHNGELIKPCVLPGSAHLEYLPPYAPELNPVEYLWAWLKTNPLANDPVIDLHLLARRTRRAACCAHSSAPPVFLDASNRTLFAQCSIGGHGLARSPAELAVHAGRLPLCH
jgi:hypothetical protein